MTTTPCNSINVKPGARPNRRRNGGWCAWNKALESWPPDELAAALAKAEKAVCSSVIRAQYAAMSEINAIQRVKQGKPGHYCGCKCHIGEKLTLDGGVAAG